MVQLGAIVYAKKKTTLKVRRAQVAKICTVVVVVVVVQFIGPRALVYQGPYPYGPDLLMGMGPKMGPLRKRGHTRGP